MTEPSPPPVPAAPQTPAGWAALAADIRTWARELGFTAIGISGIDLGADEQRLLDWLAAGFHGDMDYMARHGALRARPAELLPGTVSVISARMDYLPRDRGDAWAAEETARLADPQQAVVSVYARGRDYHKVMRSRLQALADRLAQAVGPFGHRVFTDSAPVMEVELATRAGLGWRGKHTLALAREGGSMFFLGELFTSLPLPPSEPVAAHCGQCTACIELCPTRAIVAPYRLDARRCISYLTIEHAGAIPTELRPLMGNRIYGCDDCQLVCPWNKFAHKATVPDFEPRNDLDSAALIELFAWTEADFNERLQGSPIRRIGHMRWLRNIAVALGNAPATQATLQALSSRSGHPDPLVREHVAWALAQGGDFAH